MTTARAARVSALTATCLLLGCDETPAAQRRSRGLLPDEATTRASAAQIAAARPAAPEPPSTPPPSSLPSPFVGHAPNPGALSNPDAGASPEPSATPDAGVAPARDLPSELRALLGQPATCLDLAQIEAGGGRATVTATAHVVPSGRITRAAVSVPGQPATALRCLELRLTSGSLRGPIPGAPAAVTTSIPIEVVSSTTPR